MRRGASVALVGLVLASREARAEQAPWLTGWYAPSGVSVGASLHPERPNGVVLGFEQSLVYQRGPRAGLWGGIYADIQRDFGARWTRLSVGPELGYGVVGLDFGAAAIWRDGRVDTALQGRLLATIGVAAVYGRLGVIPGGADERYGEIGLLLKWPWWLDRPPRR